MERRLAAESPPRHRYLASLYQLQDDWLVPFLSLIIIIPLFVDPLHSSDDRPLSETATFLLGSNPDSLLEF
jgi:hypothetical protein